MRTPRGNRARGSIAVEYLLLMVLIVIAGLGVTLDFARSIRCRMSEGPNAKSECAGGGNVQLKPGDDGCIGLVCQSSSNP